MFEDMLPWLMQTLGPEGAATVLAGAGVPLPPERPGSAPLDLGSSLQPDSLANGFADRFTGSALPSAPPTSRALGFADEVSQSEVPSPFLPQSVPLPLPRPSEAPQDVPTEAQSAATSGKNPLTEMLRGVQVPKAPEPVKPSSPAAPRPVAAIKPGELINMLLMLNQGQPGGGGGMKLPSTLGAALSGRG